MSYVILDLEWNGSFSKVRGRYVNEIIEFGAVKVDENYNIIDKFSLLIKPQIGKRLCDKVKELTKIQYCELVQNGVPFLEAVDRFSEFSDQCVIMTWGTSDIHALIENYSYFTNDIRLPFLKKYCNLQEYCENCLNHNKGVGQLGLSSCAEMLEIDFSQEEQHRAFADAELSLSCLKRLVTKKSLNGFIIDAEDESFYDKMTFKTHYITNINNKDIDKKQLIFYCNQCNKKAKRNSNWKLRNNSFSAEFYCGHCKKKFLGRISFKKKYDEIIVRKRIIDIADEDIENNAEDSKR